jgi:hypothetical protein
VPGFLEAVQLNWDAPVQSNCAVERLFLKLQRLSRDLQKWAQRKVGNIKLQLEMAKEILHRLEIARDSQKLSDIEDWLRKKLKLHCLGLASLERTIARLWSRILYLREGDAPTGQIQEVIAKLEVGDQLAVTQEAKHDAVLNFLSWEQPRVEITLLIFQRLGYSNIIFPPWMLHLQKMFG